jgi:chemotaxis protein MotB
MQSAGGIVRPSRFSCIRRNPLDLAHGVVSGMVSSWCLFGRFCGCEGHGTIRRWGIGAQIVNSAQTRVCALDLAIYKPCPSWFELDSIHESGPNSIRLIPRVWVTSMLHQSCRVFVLLALSTASGCALQQQYVPADELTASQLRAQELYAQTQDLQAAHAGAGQVIAGLQAEHQALGQTLAATDGQLTTANERVENLLTERAELKDRYARAMETPYDDSILTNFGSSIPGFQFDPVTGLYKFNADIQFDLGKAVIRPETIPLLKEFVSSVRNSDADGNRILIVGHTDDLRIAHGATAAKHATNWHLSTDRADAVIVELIKLGMDEEQLAAMGYAKFQPLETSTDDAARQRNRRVELYVVPAGGQVAQWDPVKSQQ